MYCLFVFYHRFHHFISVVPIDRSFCHSKFFSWKYECVFARIQAAWFLKSTVHLSSKWMLKLTSEYTYKQMRVYFTLLVNYSHDENRNAWGSCIILNSIWHESPSKENHKAVDMETATAKKKLQQTLTEFRRGKGRRSNVMFCELKLWTQRKQ